MDQDLFNLESLGVAKSAGHYVLASGLHTDVLLDMSALPRDGDEFSKITRELVSLVPKELEANWVVGVPNGANRFIYRLSRVLRQQGREIEAGIATKDVNVFSFQPGLLKKLGEGNILIFDDVYTTGGSAASVASLLQDAGANIVGFLGIAQRTPLVEIMGKPLITRYQFDLDMWVMDDCPYCERKVPFSN